MFSGVNANADPANFIKAGVVAGAVAHAHHLARGKALHPRLQLAPLLKPTKVASPAELATWSDPSSAHTMHPL